MLERFVLVALGVTGLGGCAPEVVEERWDGHATWSKRFGDASDDQGGKHVAIDGAGNVLVTGEFSGGVDLGGGRLESAGSTDVFLAKLDGDGHHLWSQRFGGTDRDQSSAVTVDRAGDVLVSGEFEGGIDFGGVHLDSAGGTDVFLAKLDGSGNHVWSKRFGGEGDDYSGGLACDSAGNVYLAGSFEGSADFGGASLQSAGEGDVYVAKLDAAGGPLWSKRFGGGGEQHAHSLAIDPTGGVLVTGAFEGAVDFGGGPLHSAGGFDVFLVKLDASGEHLWSRRFGGTSNDFSAEVAVDDAGNVLVTGWFAGTVDFGDGPVHAGCSGGFVVKLDAHGHHVWSRAFADGAGGSGVGFGVAVDGAGNVLLTGDFRGTADFGDGPLQGVGDDDLFVAKLDPSGHPLGSQRFGDGARQYGSALATDGTGNVVVTGAFVGAIDLGNGALQSAGGYDIFLAKLP